MSTVVQNFVQEFQIITNVDFFNQRHWESITIPHPSNFMKDAQEQRKKSLFKRMSKKNIISTPDFPGIILRKNDQPSAYTKRLMKCFIKISKNGTQEQTKQAYGLVFLMLKSDSDADLFERERSNLYDQMTALITRVQQDKKIEIDQQKIADNLNQDFMTFADNLKKEAHDNVKRADFHELTNSVLPNIIL